MDLKEIIELYQDKLNSEFDVIVKGIDHGGSKGTEVEDTFKKWMRDYLPSKCSIDSGFVINKNGDVSKQIDIIIYDNHFSPYIIKIGNVKYIPIESVYGVFEVKTTLDSGKYQEAVENLKSVKKLIGQQEGDCLAPAPIVMKPGGVRNITYSGGEIKKIYGILGVKKAEGCLSRTNIEEAEITSILTLDSPYLYFKLTEIEKYENKKNKENKDRIRKTMETVFNDNIPDKSKVLFQFSVILNDEIRLLGNSDSPDLYEYTKFLWENIVIQKEK